MLTVPSSCPLSRGETKERERKSSLWHRRGTFRCNLSLFFGSCPLPRSTFFPLNNTLEWRTILLLTPLLPPSNSIQGSCEQGLEPLLTALSSLFSFFSATISPSRPLFFWILKPNNKLCVVKISPPPPSNSKDVPSTAEIDEMYLKGKSFKRDFSFII